MLNVRNIRIVPAESLSPGDVALLPMAGNTPVIVSSVGGKTSAVLLVHGERPFDWFELSDVYGNAVVIEGVDFEVDPASHSENSPGLGALVRYGEQLMINVRGPVGFLQIPIADDFEKVRHLKAHFGRWRAVVREGEREFVVFEYDASASGA